VRCFHPDKASWQVKKLQIAAEEDEALVGAILEWCSLLLMACCRHLRVPFVGVTFGKARITRAPG